MERNLRRIITGINEKGKSVVMIEKPPTEIGTLWMTDSFHLDNADNEDLAERKIGLEPLPYGTIFRFFMLQPEDPAKSVEELEKEIALLFTAANASHCRPDTSRDPRMHKTNTIDYVVLLEGEVKLLLEEDEIDLKPFDVVVQRGTNHAWINIGSKPALLIAVLIDATPI